MVTLVAFVMFSGGLSVDAGFFPSKTVFSQKQQEALSLAKSHDYTQALKTYTLYNKGEKWAIIGKASPEDQKRGVLHVVAFDPNDPKKDVYVNIQIPKNGQVQFAFSTPKISHKNGFVILMDGSGSYKLTFAESFLNPTYMAPSTDKAMVDLAKKITKDKKTPLDKSKAIFYWVTQNIAYDWNKGQAKIYNATETLKNKKAQCTGYSNLVAALHRAVGIEASVVYGQKMEHVWNEIYIGDKTYFVDATWGAGYADKKGKFIKKYNPNYYSSTLWKSHKKDEVWCF
ncbi:transglutaminase domain-containing protein [Cytobacillus sp. FJAT-54145]|uniref:Transglutaminase domain-containing protein n=1 Tax=Cytobacillus spartinae TaxID=3299023 RepID=A0ABW6KE08_9BACI